jgi:hypothetical protein
VDGRTLEILNEKEARPHRLPAFARLEGARVVYDGGETVTSTT